MINGMVTGNKKADGLIGKEIDSEGTAGLEKERGNRKGGEDCSSNRLNRRDTAPAYDSN
ncbi:hypothetical protein [Bacillus norwichensis]|uniref:Uncharacterized protein n=1 Tax=Bacillus norwichensis TaxID=2762217 RepID=A0ABR8VNB9_9BACI|nr:hypothetical protein [Bacillus norwichensis]MBD8006217.1 hypothetical protein [Bacillus norwichensis]